MAIICKPSVASQTVQYNRPLSKDVLHVSLFFTLHTQETEEADPDDVAAAARRGRRRGGRGGGRN